MKKLLILAICTILGHQAIAQFSPQVGLVGSDGISKDDTLIKAWATHCTVERGWMNIANPSLGYVTHGDSTLVIGPPSFNTAALSLGDGGVATVTFEHPIMNGTGPDFVVFENGFLAPGDTVKAFLELAEVAVSSDGINFVKFPSKYYGQDTAQINTFDAMDARIMHNLAGKHMWGYGTGFDLNELANEGNLDINQIRFVRIIDVIGAIDPELGTKDSEGNIINDPYPTEFNTGGFDLSAVGVIHQNTTVSVKTIEQPAFKIYPNPATHLLYVVLSDNNPKDFRVINALGQTTLMGSLKNEQIDISNLNPGNYWLEIDNQRVAFVKK